MKSLYKYCSDVCESHWSIGSPRTKEELKKEYEKFIEDKKTEMSNLDKIKSQYKKFKDVENKFLDIRGRLSKREFDKDIYYRYSIKQIENDLIYIQSMIDVIKDILNSK